MIVLLWTDPKDLFRFCNNFLIFFILFIVFNANLLYTIKSRRISVLQNKLEEYKLWKGKVF